MTLIGRSHSTKTDPILVLSLNLTFMRTIFPHRAFSLSIEGLCLGCLLGCASGLRSRDGGPPDSGGPALDAGDSGMLGGDGGLVPLTATLVNEEFEVADHMRASREMQLSGEPFAQLLGYSLAGFNRTLSITDEYYDAATNTWRVDPLGYALAIESYEYSKQPMNNLSFESGAGLSLMYGPVLNPLQQSGDGGFGPLLNRFQQFALEANAGAATGNLIMSPAPSDNPLNFYGWPGWWPVFAEFSSFQPAINPVAGAVNTCTSSGTVGAFSYGGGGPVSAATYVADYECDYNSLNLPNRATQVSMTLDPAGLGYATWKQGLWTINYWGTLQDTGGNPITVVAPGDRASVGQPNNMVVGFYPGATGPGGQITYDAGLPGVYLGDIPMEGWQGLTMLEEIDNKAQFLLASLLSSDGAALGGVATLQAATDYSYDTSPVLYFPASVAVTEVQTAPSAKDADKFFPRPTAFTLADGQSLLRSLSGLIGGFGEAFAMTDRNNPQVGGSTPFLATFDGDPFPMDDGRPDGESTLHDRTLGVLKIALVDLDRLHLNASAQVLVDSTSIVNGAVSQGTSVTTLELNEAILALRNAFRALNGTLQLYSNDTPDTQGVSSALDATPLSGASYSGTLSAHLIQLIAMEADFLSGKLISSSGAVANGYDLGTGTADPSPSDLASEAAAIRGLLEAYLATSNESYRDQAIAVYQDLESRFWMSDAMVFRTTAGVDDLMQYTPARFGMLWGALRQYYKLVASQNAEGPVVLQRIKRTFKRVVNGWNDLNQDDTIQYPGECMHTGIEMGERALTGELGNPGDDGDRERDCVREISYVGLPAALGSELDLSR